MKGERGADPATPMKYLEVIEREGRYAATLRETYGPVPKSGEVLVRVAGSGVNRADLSQIAGRYPPPPGESEILGMEVSGTRVEAGEKVWAVLGGCGQRGGGGAEVRAPRARGRPRRCGAGADRPLPPPPRRSRHRSRRGDSRG